MPPRSTGMPGLDAQHDFVRDGHHRVSVARALGRTGIDAYITDVGGGGTLCSGAARACGA